MKRPFFAMMIACGALAFGAWIGCAAQTPQQLIDARAQYQRAASGPAVQHAQSHLDTARKALIRAEQAFDKHPRDEETVDLAYTAQRLAQLAEAEAALDIAKADKTAAENELKIARGEEKKENQEGLVQSERELAKKEAELGERQKVEAADRKAEREHQARIDAERSAKEAKDQLAKIAQVKEEERGMVVTLPGSLLFTSGKYNLIPDAASKLDAIVDALRTSKNQRVIIEGHTDSTGTAAANQRLSENRARAVRDYLLRHGIASNRIESRGMGSQSPVADNSTPEGRANNRRVEIVFERAPSS